MNRSLQWDDGINVAIDQRQLPLEHRWLRITTLEEFIEAIAALVISGAPVLSRCARAWPKPWPSCAWTCR